SQTSFKNRSACTNRRRTGSNWSAKFCRACAWRKTRTGFWREKDVHHAGQHAQSQQRDGQLDPEFFGAALVEFRATRDVDWSLWSAPGEEDRSQISAHA